MTGSRVAGLCGHAVVLDVMRQCSQLVQLFVFSGHVFQISSWIDNLYALGSSSSDACSRLESFEEVLRARWRLEFKASSQKVCCARRADRNLSCRAFVWQLPFVVLGSLIGPCCSAWADFKAAEQSAWRRLWAGAASKSARGLHVDLKVADIQRCCWPSLGYRCSWWPMGSTLASLIRALQRALVATILRLPREQWETDEHVARRRGREAGRLCDQVGC